MDCMPLWTFFDTKPGQVVVMQHTTCLAQPKPPSCVRDIRDVRNRTLYYTSPGVYFLTAGHMDCACHCGRFWIQSQGRWLSCNIQLVLPSQSNHPAQEMCETSEQRLILYLTGRSHTGMRTGRWGVAQEGFTDLLHTYY